MGEGGLLDELLLDSVEIGGGVGLGSVDAVMEDVMVSSSSESWSDELD